MAALPENQTSRVFFDYVTGNGTSSQEHTIAWRAPGAGGASDPDQVQQRFLNFLQSIGAANFYTGWRIVRVRFQQAGTNFSLPSPLNGLLSAFVGTGGNLTSTENEAREWTFQGRSFTSGRRVDFSVYGISGTTPGNFRYPAGGTSPAWVQNAVNNLNGSNVNTGPVCIDGSLPTWYDYVNCQYNSYWEARIRSV